MTMYHKLLLSKKHSRERYDSAQLNGNKKQYLASKEAKEFQPGCVNQPNHYKHMQNLKKAMIKGKHTHTSNKNETSTLEWKPCPKSSKVYPNSLKKRSTPFLFNPPFPNKKKYLKNANVKVGVGSPTWQKAPWKWQGRHRPFDSGRGHQFRRSACVTFSVCQRASGLCCQLNAHGACIVHFASLHFYRSSPYLHCKLFNGTS